MKYAKPRAFKHCLQAVQAAPGRSVISWQLSSRSCYARLYLDYCCRLQLQQQQPSILSGIYQPSLEGRCCPYPTEAVLYYPGCRLHSAQHIGSHQCPADTKHAAQWQRTGVSEHYHEQLLQASRQASSCSTTSCCDP